MQSLIGALLALNLYAGYTLMFKSIDMLDIMGLAIVVAVDMFAIYKTLTMR